MSHPRHPHAQLIGALCLVCASFSHAEPARIEAAHRAYHQGQFDRSLMLYEQLAAQGDAEAAERAGFMLMQGPAVYGPQVRPDPARATALLEQAAGAGRPHAVFVLGMMHGVD
jgi:TPR repeat protein